MNRSKCFFPNWFLGESLMERIMKQKFYREDPEYNTDYVVQLVDNYRSHEMILKFPNGEFYNDRLRARAPESQVNVALGTDILVNPQVPIVLQGSFFMSYKDPNGHSWYNTIEIQIVKEYVVKLMTEGLNGMKVKASEIGIVTPYVSQMKKIVEAVNAPGIEIGTTEHFQGREKGIIIFSTVKSQAPLGFLKNEKRMNVSLTRAKYLLIVIGNPDTLQNDRIWYRFIDFCFRNNCYRGSEFVLSKNYPQHCEDDTVELEYEN